MCQTNRIRRFFRGFTIRLQPDYPAFNSYEGLLKLGMEMSVSECKG